MVIFEASYLVYRSAGNVIPLCIACVSSVVVRCGGHGVILKSGHAKVNAKCGGWQEFLMIGKRQGQAVEIYG
jgi:hypothetical protein